MTATLILPKVMFRVTPIPDDFLRRVRNDGVDDQRQPVMRLRAEGGEPCRDALRRARAGEELILASFTPFAKPGPYKEYGPIFVLAQSDEDPVRLDRFPTIGSDGGYFAERFVIRAYSADEAILDAALITGVEVEETIERFFASEKTAFLHVRFPVYGCFACRIDRA